MVNYGLSFGRNVVSDILDEVQVHNVVALMENFLDYSDFLGSEVDSKRVQKKVKSMRRHRSRILGVEFLYVGVTAVEILDIPSEKLELKFVINFG